MFLRNVLKHIYIYIVICGIVLVAGLAYGVPVQTIIGLNVNGPQVRGPGIAEILCTAPAECPDYWDTRETEGQGIFYGSNAVATTDTSCFKSTNFGQTWALCPGSYPVSGVGREVDINANGDILSMRFENAAFAGCRLDRSTDGGNSWTTINIVTGANLQCAVISTTFPGGRMYCSHETNICLARIRNFATGTLFIYRSGDGGLTWSNQDTYVPVACQTALNVIVLNDDQSVATCHRYITGGGGDRYSADSLSWVAIPPAANIDYCGQATENNATSPPFSMACGNSTITDLRIQFADGSAITPIQQNIGPTDTLNPFATPTLMQRSVGQLYLTYLDNVPSAHILFSNNNGSQFVEMAQSVAGTFNPGRPWDFRAVDGDLYFSDGTAFVRIR